MEQFFISGIIIMTGNTLRRERLKSITVSSLPSPEQSMRLTKYSMRNSSSRFRNPEIIYQGSP